MSGSSALSASSTSFKPSFWESLRVGWTRRVLGHGFLRHRLRGLCVRLQRVGEETSARPEDELTEDLVDLGFDLADERDDSLLDGLKTVRDGAGLEILAVKTLQEAEVETEQRVDQVQRHLQLEELLHEEEVHGLH